MTWLDWPCRWIGALVLAVSGLVLLWTWFMCAIGHGELDRGTAWKAKRKR